jgi:hypothetical protein
MGGSGACGGLVLTVSQISNFTVVSLRATVCVRNAAAKLTNGELEVSLEHMAS